MNGTIKACTLISIMFPIFVGAQGVVINEVAWMGTPVPGVAENQWWRYEWLELFNAGESMVSLDGWSVELRRENLDFAIPLAGYIPSKGYFLVVSSGKIPLAHVNYANLGGKFFNGGQLVLLKDSSGTVRDEVDARGGWFAGDNTGKETMERTDPLKESSDSSNWHTSEVAGGSPGQENSRVLEIAKEKTGSSAKPVFTPLPLHFVLALAVALVVALAAVWLRRFLRTGGGSFGDPGY